MGSPEPWRLGGAPRTQRHYGLPRDTGCRLGPGQDQGLALPVGLPTWWRPRYPCEAWQFCPVLGTDLHLTSYFHGKLPSWPEVSVVNTPAANIRVFLCSLCGVWASAGAALGRASSVGSRGGLRGEHPHAGSDGRAVCRKGRAAPSVISHCSLQSPSRFPVCMTEESLAVEQ